MCTNLIPVLGKLKINRFIVKDAGTYLAYDSKKPTALRHKVGEVWSRQASFGGGRKHFFPHDNTLETFSPGERKQALVSTVCVHVYQVFSAQMRC